MFKKLDPLLHSELRLAVMSILVNLEEADFVYLREATGATAGNLSVQIDKLTAAKTDLFGKLKIDLKDPRRDLLVDDNFYIQFSHLKSSIKVDLCVT